jgi:hypothetical protein
VGEQSYREVEWVRVAWWRLYAPPINTTTSTSTSPILVEDTDMLVPQKGGPVCQPRFESSDPSSDCEACCVSGWRLQFDRFGPGRVGGEYVARSSDVETRDGWGGSNVVG